MRLRSKLKHLEKSLVGGLDCLELEDGSKHYFSPSDAQMAVFMSEYAIGKAASRGQETMEFSPLIRAVSRATEEDRERFVSRYRCPFTGPTIVNTQIPRVRFQWVELDGDLRTETLVGEEAATYLKEKQRHDGAEASIT